MNYIENLRQLYKELKENEEYILCLNNRYFYIESNDKNYNAILTVVENEIEEIAEIENYGFDYKIINFTPNVSKPIDYKKNLINLYEEFLSLNKVLTNKILVKSEDYETYFNLKVIINSKIFNIEISNIDLMTEFIKEIMRDYVSDKEIRKIESKYTEPKYS